MLSFEIQTNVMQEREFFKQGKKNRITMHLLTCLARTKRYRLPGIGHVDQTEINVLYFELKDISY